MSLFDSKHPNSSKYLKAPSIEQIKKVIDAHGVVTPQFERFYDMPEKTLQKTLRGERSVPVKYWHIFYECLKMIDNGKPMPLYKEDQPKEPSFKINIPFFNRSPKKKSPKRKTIKRTGTLCELC
jgi:hypothetical protein